MKIKESEVMRYLCKRSLIIGKPYYFDELTGEKKECDRRMLVAGDWYDVVYNENDTEETFSVIDNQGNRHLHYNYGEEGEKDYNLPRNYAKWFYTPGELEIKKQRQIKKIK